MSDEATRAQGPRCSFWRGDGAGLGKVIAGPEALVCEERAAVAVEIIRADKGEKGRADRTSIRRGPSIDGER